MHGLPPEYSRGVTCHFSPVVILHYDAFFGTVSARVELPYTVGFMSLFLVYD